MPTDEQMQGDNPFYYWIKTKDVFSNQINFLKVRVRRKDGTQGYSMPMFSMHNSPHATQEYWKDSDGTTHEKDYYPEWAFLKKDGGKSQ